MRAMKYIINQHARIAYELPDGIEFSTGNQYTTFEHVRLSLLPTELMTLIVQDLRPRDVLRLDTLRDSDLVYYTVRRCESATGDATDV